LPGPVEMPIGAEPRAHLLVLAPQSSRACVPLFEEPCTVGGAAGASVYVDDPALGPGFQVRLSEEWVVIDALSENLHAVVRGRSVGGGRLTIRPGEVVTIGPCTFVVVLGTLPESVKAWGVTSLADSAGPHQRLLGVDEAVLTRIAQSGASVLLHGESGSGKELVSRFIHDVSPRRRAPFLAINAGALPGSLLEAELFGHVRGAFTGADRDRQGLIASADGGTLLLDEIGELPLGSQAKLLRLLDTREVLPVGSSRPQRVDVRFLSATNRDLQKEVERGEFREDLYYRLAGFTVEIPPLRDRVNDIVPLAVRFLDQMVDNADRHLELSRDAQAMLLAHSWPGNVRELKNVIHRAVMLADHEARLEPSHFPDLASTPSLSTALPGKSLDRRANEKELIIRALKATVGNQTRAARKLGMSRRTLVAKLKLYDLPRPRAGR
jgi:two-component system response regulator AtoC